MKILDAICLTDGGPNPGKPCVFPFTHEEKTYNHCPPDLEGPILLNPFSFTLMLRNNKLEYLSLTILFSLD